MLEGLRHLSLFLILFLTAACESYIGGDINLDPNKPADLPIDVLLAQSQISMADTYGGYHSRVNCTHTQQVEGVLRSFFFAHFSSPSQFDQPWEEMYESLGQLTVLQERASNEGLNHYLGITNVMKAFVIMIGTDVWGDMPYSEAGQGFDILHPRFDSQSSIYVEIHELLDDALDLFSSEAGPIAPAVDDFIYGGNIATWIKAAHGLKARAYLHYGDYGNALFEATSSFTDRSESMSLVYPDETYAAPWYQYNLDRTGDFEFHPTMRSEMQNLNDLDRLAVLDQPFTTSHPYFIASFKMDLISYREIQFIIAEAGVETGAASNVIRDAYLNGINASFMELGFVDTSSEFTNYTSQATVDPGLGNITVNEIMIQKYIGLFAQPEVYSDWRRRDIPALVPLTGSAVPVRWHYSSTVFEFNENAPAESSVDIYADKVDWDN